MWVLGISRKVLNRCMMLQKDKTRKEVRREIPCSYRSWEAEEIRLVRLKDYGVDVHVVALCLARETQSSMTLNDEFQLQYQPQVKPAFDAIVFSRA